MRFESSEEITGDARKSKDVTLDVLDPDCSETLRLDCPKHEGEKLRWYFWQPIHFRLSMVYERLDRLSKEKL